MNRFAVVFAASCALAPITIACSKSQPSAAADAASAGPIEIAAADLAKAYKADRAAADGKYKGKRVRVSGFVGEARVGAFTLGNEDDADSVVECSFGEEYKRAGSSLAKGVRMTLDCDCEGMSTLVTLKRCTFGAPPASSAAASDGKSSADVCAKLEAAGIAAKCRAPDGATNRTRFDLVSLPGKGGLVNRLADDATYAKYVAGLAAQPESSPLRPFVSAPSARIVVHLAAGVTPDVEAKTKAVLDAL